VKANKSFNKTCKETKVSGKHKQVTQVPLGLEACLEFVGKYPPHWS